MKQEAKQTSPILMVKSFRDSLLEKYKDEKEIPAQLKMLNDLYEITGFDTNKVVKPNIDMDRRLIPARFFSELSKSTTKIKKRVPEIYGLNVVYRHLALYNTLHDNCLCDERTLKLYMLNLGKILEKRIITANILILLESMAVSLMTLNIDDFNMMYGKASKEAKEDVYNVSINEYILYLDKLKKSIESFKNNIK